MDIVIVADFIGKLNGDDNNRFLYLANRLSKKHSVEIITSDYNHELKAKFDSIIEYPFAITMIKEIGYPRNVCIKRFVSHYIWGKEVYKYLRKRKRPDVVYCAIPTLKAAELSAKYCKKNGIKYIIDVQDLWPEAFKMVLNIPIVSDLFFLPFSIIANKAYKKADIVYAVSKTYVNRVLRVNKNAKKAMAVYIGTNIEEFNNNVKNNREKVYDLLKVYNKENRIWIGYCGSLSESYDIEVVIDAMKILKLDYGINDVDFIVMGDGNKRQYYEKYARSSEVSAYFTGKLSYDLMCATLSFCDLTVNPIKAKSAASIINKHADYVACGLPTVNTQDSKEYRKLIEEYNMGYNVKNGDALDLAKKILYLLQNPDIRITMGKNALTCADEMFDRSKTYLQIEKDIDSLGE